MQTTAPDRDDRQVDTAPQDAPADDAGFQELFALWRDLGGSD
jgi:hypothetical protein